MAVSCCDAKEMLFEAVLDGARWTEFLQSTSRCLGASSAFIMSKSPRRDHRPAYEVGLARGTIRRYYEYFHHIDTWWACIPPPVAGRFRLVRGKDLCDSHALLESEFYTEFLVPNRIRYMRALVVTPEAPLAAPFIVSWHRSADQGPFPAEADETITELGPVLVQAERLGTELVRARIEDVHAEPAYFVLGASGQLLQANAGGASLLEGGMFGAEDGMLRPASVEAAAWLRAHLDTGTIASGFRPVITPLPTAIDGFAAPGGIRARARPLPRLTTALGPEGSAIDHTLEMRARYRSPARPRCSSCIRRTRPIPQASRRAPPSSSAGRRPSSTRSGGSTRTPPRTRSPRRASARSRRFAPISSTPSARPA